VSAPLPIRPLESREELVECVRLQEATWGEGFQERVPTAILKIAGRFGGVVSGAFDGERMVGFVFGLTGLEGGQPVHWSDMLAVLPAYRGRGLGRALKLHQRERLLAFGVSRMYWTFDPLVARNAYLNLSRLGAVAREYVEDMYGASDSPLHRGIGTDRLVVVWEMDGPRVRERIAGKPPPVPVGEEPEAALAARPGADPARPRPGEPRLGLEGPGVTVAVPADVQALKAADPALAREWREATRAALASYLAGGWEARELLPPAEGNLPRYLLVR
jgi:predicted GNAT superfamily acetyltransferase